MKKTKISRKTAGAEVSWLSPLGWLQVRASSRSLLAVQFRPERPAGDRPSALVVEAIRQLQEYFSGRRRNFDLPLAPAGTAFQQAVWQALLAIPYGQVRSYQQVAEAVGNRRACRAVGQANHANPIAIVIPCHRVIGATGALVGYGAGLERKERLLRFEKEHTPPSGGRSAVRAVGG